MFTSATQGHKSLRCLQNSVDIYHGDDIQSESYDYIIKPPLEILDMPDANGEEILQPYPANTYQDNLFAYSIDMPSISGPITLTYPGESPTAITNAFFAGEYSCQFNSGLDNFNLILSVTGVYGGTKFSDFDVIATVENVNTVEEAASICFNTDNAIGFVYENNTVKLFDMRINYKNAISPRQAGYYCIKNTDLYVNSIGGSIIGSSLSITDPVVLNPYRRAFGMPNMKPFSFVNVDLFNAPYTGKVYMFMNNVPVNTRFKIGTMNPHTLLNQRYTGISKTRMYPMEITISFQNPLQTLNLKVYIDEYYRTCKIQNTANDQYMIPSGSVIDPSSFNTDWYFHLPYFSNNNLVKKVTYPGTDYDCVFINCADNTKVLYGVAGTVAKNYDIKYSYRNLVFYKDSVCEFYESNTFSQAFLEIPSTRRTYYPNFDRTLTLKCKQHGIPVSNLQIPYMTPDGSIMKLDWNGISEIDEITVSDGLQYRFFCYRYPEQEVDSRLYDYRDETNHTSHFLVRGTMTGLLSGAYRFNQTFVRKFDTDRRAGIMALRCRQEEYPANWPPWSNINKTVCVLTNGGSNSVSLKPSEYWEPGLWGGTLGDKQAVTLTLEAGFRADIFDNYGYNGNTYTFWGPTTVANIEIATDGMVKNNSLSSIRIEPVVIPSSIPRPVARLYQTKNKTGYTTDVYNNDIHKIYNTDTRVFRSFDILDSENFTGTMTSNKLTLTSKTGVDRYVRFAIEGNKIKVVDPRDKNNVLDIFSIFGIGNNLFFASYDTFIVLVKNGDKQTSLQNTAGPNTIYTQPEAQYRTMSRTEEAELFFWTYGIYIILVVGAVAALAAIRTIPRRPLPTGRQHTGQETNRTPIGNPGRSPRPSAESIPQRGVFSGNDDGGPSPPPNKDDPVFQLTNYPVSTVLVNGVLTKGNTGLPIQGVAVRDNTVTFSTRIGGVKNPDDPQTDPGDLRKKPDDPPDDVGADNRRRLASSTHEDPSSGIPVHLTWGGDRGSRERTNASPYNPYGWIGIPRS
jgi:hypothetical protein